MDIEKFKKKYTHPDTNEKLGCVQKLFWWLFVLFPFLIFTVNPGYTLFIYFTGDDNKSYNISNIGFAILISLSSVCFSYYKLLDNGNYIRLHKDVQRSGEFFLTSAIAFIISSALKYSWTLHTGNSTLLKASLGITFFVAEFFSILGLAWLIDVLYRRMTNSKANLSS